VSDEELVASSLAGNDAAFAELVARHKRKVFAMAARFGRDDQQIDDIAQETFIRVWRSLAKFRADAPFEHWLSRIAVHACYDFLRKHRHEREHVALDENLDAPSHDTRNDAAEILHAALAQLSPKERLVITLLELEEKSVREISMLTGWSESNVKVRAFRARAALKRILEQRHE